MVADLEALFGGNNDDQPEIGWVSTLNEVEFELGFEGLSATFFVP